MNCNRKVQKDAPHRTEECGAPVLFKGFGWCEEKLYKQLSETLRKYDDEIEG